MSRPQGPIFKNTLKLLTPTNHSSITPLQLRMDVHWPLVAKFVALVVDLDFLIDDPDLQVLDVLP